MSKAALLVSAALALAPAAARADYVYEFANIVPPGSAPDLYVTMRLDDAVAKLGHFTVYFDHGTLQPTEPADWHYFYSFDLLQDAGRDPLGDGEISLTINPDGSIQGGTLDNTYKGDHFFLGDVLGDTWAGTLNGKTVFGRQWTVLHFSGTASDPPGVQSVPEPAALALLPVGLLGLAMTRRRTA